MNRERVRRLIDDLGIHVAESGPNGIEIVRAGHVVSPAGDPGALVLNETGIGGTWAVQHWRVVSGGGIATNSEVWWIRPVSSLNGPSHGPYRTMRELTAALRKWRKFERKLVDLGRKK